MSRWIFVPALLFLAVLIFMKIANKQTRNRQQRSFKTNYQAKKQAQKKKQ